MNQNLSKRIVQMAEMDQLVRNNAMAGSEQGAAATPGTANYLIYVADLSHGLILKEIVREFGFPKKELVGDEGIHAFWLLVQHQDFDIGFQKKCLENIEFSLKDRAYLTDRVLVNSGQKQMYGTQFNQPIEDEAGVDARRAAIGLEPLAEYVRKAK